MCGMLPSDFVFDRKNETCAPSAFTHLNGTPSALRERTLSQALSSGKRQPDKIPMPNKSILNDRRRPRKKIKKLVNDPSLEKGEHM